jgi:hypothetical protein
MPPRLNQIPFGSSLLGPLHDERDLERRAFRLFGEERCGQHRPRTHRKVGALTTSAPPIPIDGGSRRAAS